MLVDEVLNTLVRSLDISCHRELISGCVRCFGNSQNGTDHYGGQIAETIGVCLVAQELPHVRRQLPHLQAYGLVLS